MKIFSQYHSLFLSSILRPSATLKRSITALGICTLMISTVMPAQAITVYKSVENGIVKYSQLPPENASDVEVLEFRIDGRRTDKGQLAGKTNDSNSSPASAEEQRIAQLEARLDEQEAKEVAAQCQQKRNDLTNLESGGRIYELGENGEKNFLDDKKIDLKRQQIKKALSQYCSGQTT